MLRFWQEAVRLSSERRRKVLTTIGLGVCTWRPFAPIMSTVMRHALVVILLGFLAMTAAACASSNAVPRPFPGGPVAKAKPRPTAPIAPDAPNAPGAPI